MPRLCQPKSFVAAKGETGQDRKEAQRHGKAEIDGRCGAVRTARGTEAKIAAHCDAEDAIICTVRELSHCVIPLSLSFRLSFDSLFL